MSEFSDSLHIYNNSIDNVKSILTELNISSVIIGNNNKTITVIMDWEDKLKIRSKFKVLDYSYGEDHGLWLRFYNKNTKEFARIEFSWDDPEVMGLTPDQMGEPVITENYADILEKEDIISFENKSELIKTINNFDKMKWELRENFVDNIGTILNLFCFKWLSFDGFLPNVESYKMQYPNIIIINK